MTVGLLGAVAVVAAAALLAAAGARTASDALMVGAAALAAVGVGAGLLATPASPVPTLDHEIPEVPS